MCDDMIFSSVPDFAFTAETKQCTGDASFFATHPDRRYRLRPVGDDELDAEFGDSGHDSFVVVRRNESGDLTRRAFTGKLQWTESEELAAYWLWRLWEVDTGGEIFTAQDLSLLIAVGQLHHCEPPPRVDAVSHNHRS